MGRCARKVEFADPWATVEYSGWHVHANLDTVTKVRFAEAPGHGNSVSVFVSLDEAAGNVVVRFYFPHASQTHQTYAAQELVLFETLKARNEQPSGRKMSAVGRASENLWLFQQDLYIPSVAALWGGRPILVRPGKHPSPRPY